MEALRVRLKTSKITVKMMRWKIFMKCRKPRKNKNLLRIKKTTFSTSLELKRKITTQIIQTKSFRIHCHPVLKRGSQIKKNSFKNRKSNLRRRSRNQSERHGLWTTTDLRTRKVKVKTKFNQMMSIATIMMGPVIRLLFKTPLNKRKLMRARRSLPPPLS